MHYLNNISAISKLSQYKILLNNSPLIQMSSNLINQLLIALETNKGKFK